jgi:hypothetical protein
VVADRRDQRPLADAVARRARGGHDRRPPPALRWAGRPDRPAPRRRRVVGYAVHLAQCRRGLRGAVLRADVHHVSPFATALWARMQERSERPR